MKPIIQSFLFQILRLFRYGPALEHAFLRKENRILRRKLREQGMFIDDIEAIR